ncbi:MAG: FCD domain-containing protein, partial [Bifidobacteriaceae bacterium]|nr:FCD domain-containing protein [Bifidobacteriaceae bacterium]
RAVAAGDLDAMVATDVDLHRHISELAGNRILAELYSIVLGAVVDNIRFNFSHLGQEGNSHEDLVEAIAQGDAAAAALEIDRYLGQMMAESMRA